MVKNQNAWPTGQTTARYHWKETEPKGAHAQMGVYLPINMFAH